MILTVTDTVQTSGGPLRPLEVFEDDRLFYGFNGTEFVGLPFVKEAPKSIYVNSCMLIETSAKTPEGISTYAKIPYDYFVLLADGEYVPAHELSTGMKIAYFTRIMRHEKYSAMRVVPFMQDRVLEHRWVWETHSGLDIPETHNVDHIDGNSYNNHYTNLRALDIRSHSKMTAHRQRNRHTRRNADGSFAKGSSTARIASANQPIPEHLSTGVLYNTCRVLSVEETTLDDYFFQYDVIMPEDCYLVMGNLLVQPYDI
jgi:hypothetical protein